MGFLLDYWYVILGVAAVAIGGGIAVYRFVGIPTEKQLEKVREWLLYAVTVAEKELGAGTGKLKLRYVYDWFLQVFPWLARIIDFETFADMVDEALEEMKQMLDVNAAVAAYVAADDNDSEEVQ